MFASLYVQPLGPMGTNYQGRSATGFVLRARDGRPFLITNRHVVTGENSLDNLKRPDDHVPISALRIAMHDANRFGVWRPYAMALGEEREEQSRPLWLEHPRHGSAMDVVAIPITSLDESQVDLVAYPGNASGARFGLTGELQVIGFPAGFDPINDGAPLGVWARGTIAWPPSLDWRHLPAFLIDCRARPGQSGSPVVFYADELTRFRTADGDIGTGPFFEFVGVYSGRIRKDSDIGIVWKRSAVREIVEAGLRPEAPWVPPLQVPLETLTDSASFTDSDPDS